MKRQDILEAIAEGESAIKDHYVETLAWCKETDFPEHLIGVPDSIRDIEPAKPRHPDAPKRRAYLGDHRFHRKGCGWKKLHES